MKYYKVTFEWYGTGTWCANIAQAESQEKVFECYKKYGGPTMVTEAKAWELEEAQRKGMPIVMCA